jgi:hypothetical protein
MLRRRLLWGICLFSSTIRWWRRHGYPEWFFGDAVLPVQDAMISYLSLLSYATALWLHSEVFDLKTICRACTGCCSLLSASILCFSPAFPRLLRAGHADRGGDVLYRRADSVDHLMAALATQSH